MKDWVRFELGKVYCSKEAGGKEIPFVLLFNNDFNFEQLLSILNIQPLTLKHQWYLYNKIRQYVDEEFKDVLCPSSFN
ncbi:1405_t:CDS:2 [Funneliformis geosporum]|uniref:1405_t:CDS:1 n=1 Tax=Funneliformis geosporum TaxID=1117311 RepID=A0A9W4T084_9GLOM|nr:1405_t:CDS:2 [Funneliformis geosporum]